MLSNIQFYSQQELTQIDNLVQNSMDSYLESMISHKILSLLQDQMDNYGHATSQFHSNSYEENVCNLFNSICESWKQKQKVYVGRINQQQLQKQEKNLLVAQKQQIIEQQKEEISRISIQYLKQSKQKHSLNAKYFSLFQQLSCLKSTLTKQLYTKQAIIQQQQSKINELQLLLKEKKVKNEQLTAINEQLKLKQQNLQHSLQQIEELLYQDVERHKLHLITSNIMINQLRQSYDEKINQIQKYAQIHKENKQIISLILKINQCVGVNLVQIEKYQFLQNSLTFCQGSFFDSLNQSFRMVVQRLTKYSQDYHRLAKCNQNSQQIIKEKQLDQCQLQRQYNKTLQNLSKSQHESTILKQLINKQKDQHYSMLIEVDKNKRKIEDSLLQNLCELKKIQQKYLLLDHQNRQKQNKINQLISKLSQALQQKQSLAQQCKQKQKLNFQLKQQILNTKSNLDIMLKTQQDDQDSNFNIVQQLIDKNNQLTNQITMKKMQIDLKQEKISYQEKIIEQYNQEIENLTQQIERINDNNKQLEMELQIQQKECKASTQKIQSLQNEIEEMNRKECILRQKTFKQVEIQTDQIHQTVESRIKRQIIPHPPKNEVQKSHSLLSQRNQSKQNTSNNANKQNLLSTRQKQSYKQKIVTLNEIINYMLNYVKGYQVGEIIRCGSWFINQIEKYGAQYEMKIFDPLHLQPKLKNIRFIDRLCKQDQNCNKLIKEFQSIMQFYFNRASKLSTSSLSITPITQQKLNKTVNKSKNTLNKYNF